MEAARKLASRSGAARMLGGGIDAANAGLEAEVVIPVVKGT